MGGGEEGIFHELIDVSHSCRCEGGRENPRRENGHKRVSVLCVEVLGMFTGLFFIVMF